MAQRLPFGNQGPIYPRTRQATARMGETPMLPTPMQAIEALQGLGDLGEPALPPNPNAVPAINPPPYSGPTPIQMPSQMPSGLRPGQRFYQEMPPSAPGYHPGQQTLGEMDYSGPQLNTESALSGLKSASGSLPTGQGLLPDSEVSRLAHRSPTSTPGNAWMPPWMQKPNQVLPATAPGANDYWSNIQDAREAEDKGRADFERKQSEAAMGAITGMHPAIQAGAEATARRAAYPQQASGEANIEAARIGAAGRLGAAQATLQGRQIGRDATSVAAALRALTAAQTPLEGEDYTDESYKQRVREAQRMIEAIRQGQFFDYDEDPYFDEEPY